MKLVIVGGGAVGEAIIASLWQTTDIILIDHDPQIVEKLFNKYDIQALVGDGTDINILDEANIHQADVFISVTNSDEENILAAIFSRQFGVEDVYARVRQAKYYDAISNLKERLGISQVMNPEMDAAKEIKEIISFPSANNVEQFLEGQLSLVEIRVQEEDQFVNQALNGFRQKEGEHILVCAIERQGQVLIPTGEDCMLAGDLVHLISSQKHLQDFMNQQLARPIGCLRDLFIVGAGNISYNLLKLLKNKSYHIKLIEKDPSLAFEFAERFPHVDVICADGTEKSILEAEGIQHFDCCLSLTKYDETNMMISLLAKQFGIKKIITKINRTDFLKISEEMGLDAVVIPKAIMADKMIRVIRSLKASRHSAISNFHQILDGRVETSEFEVLSESKITKKPFKDLYLIDDTLIAAIYRQDQLIVPDGDDQIQVGDRVIIVSCQKNLSDLTAIVK